MTNLIKNLFAGSILTISLAGCSSEEPVISQTTNQAITFSTNVTRASGTTWDANDRIGVYMKVHSDASWDGTTVVDEGANVSYTTSTAGTSGLFKATDPTKALKYPKNNQETTYDFIAYYPYTTTVTNGVYKVDVSNQNKPETIDLLYSDNSKKIPSTSTNNTLNFSHKLASVTLVIKSTDGKDISGLKASVMGVPATADFNLKDATFTNVGAATSDIPMNVTGYGTTVTATALLIPQSSVKESGQTISLSNADGTKSQTFTLKGKDEALVQKFESGKNYTFNINVSNIGETVTAPANFIQRTETPYVSPEQWSNPNIKYEEFSASTTRSVTAAGSNRNYSMLYDTSKKMALWVAYPLNGSYMGDLDRPKNWSYAPGISTADQIDVRYGSYKERNNPSYDKGHQIPNADRDGNEALQKQTFYVTNQTPQVSSMNQGIWVDLEEQVRRWAPGISTDTLFVTTGPIFGTENIRYATDQSNKKIEVPASYFKVIARVTRDASGKITGAQTLGFIIPNTEAVAKDNYMKYVRSVKEVEEQTGYKFFPFLDDKYKTSKTW